MAGSQNKSTLRKRLRSALAHKSGADAVLDAIVAMQSALNGTLDKLAADSDVALDTDYEADLAISSVFESDEPKLPAQHHRSLREVLRSALAHRALADELCDAMEEMQVAMNALLVKLDAEAGTLDDTDYESSLALSVMDPESSPGHAQHEQSMRRSLRSAMANQSLADAWLDSLVAAQEAFNSALVDLDAADLSTMADKKVSPLDPESRS